MRVVRWSKIARSLPGRTDNEIKNYWRTHLRKKVQAQEHDKLQKEIKDAMSKVQEFLMQDGDHHLNIQAANYNYIGSMKENTLTSPFGFGFPDYNPSAALPYEANFHNFISGSLDYQFELKYHDESNSLNTWFSNSTWTSGDDNNVLDSHGSAFIGALSTWHEARAHVVKLRTISILAEITGSRRSAAGGWPLTDYVLAGMKKFNTN
ncbi:hypothetical protein Scep_005192 [Stephania cephalantha]|uniref:Uncharacterized protein n=1 Tax=Stephania cephalantha TaxID=152367 RepID=A0AAP0PW46_9MAGN